jgi:NAD(P)-dependent dehydrogenase (short-subunit alcohol dehydrogenase family)
LARLLATLVRPGNVFESFPHQRAHACIALGSQPPRRTPGLFVDREVYRLHVSKLSLFLCKSIFTAPAVRSAEAVKIGWSAARHGCKYVKSPMFRFDNQRVLIVGGSSGIGLAAAAGFAKAGASVTIAARNLERLANAATTLGHGVQTARLDVMDDKAVEKFFEMGEPWRHVVVSGSSVKLGPVRKLPLFDAYSAMNSKFWGAYRIARVARIEPEGSLTFVSGLLSRKPSPDAVLQGAINAALEALAQGLALELAPVRVNTVSPGIIVTPLWDAIPEDKRRAMFEASAAQLPVQRVGQPEDVANAILYLAATPFASGSTVFVDGGGAIA